MYPIQNSQKLNYSNISITAYRAIKIFKLLMEKPCSALELIDALEQDEVTEKSISDDTLRLTLNSLKTVGCEIARPVPTNNFKYILVSHPFKYGITKTQANILAKIRQSFLHTNDWRKIAEINDLYDKFAEFLNDEEIKNILSYKKPFFKISKPVLKFLIENNISKKELVFTYNLSSKKTDIINIVAEYVFCEKGRLYIMGWYPKRKSFSYFNAEKIKEIHSVKSVLNNYDNDIQVKKVIYKINKSVLSSFSLAEDEKIVLTNSEGCIIEANAKNEFKIIQRILSFGSDCKLIEPRELKQKISDKLCKIRARYEE